MKNNRANQPARHWLDPWHVDPSSNREYDFIDGLRGLAILMVLVCHSFYGRSQENSAGQFFLQFSSQLGRGVDLFFTISGFLISWPFWKRKANGADTLMPPGYGWRRFWKIYPPLALSVLLLTPLYILCHGQAPVFLRAALQWLTGLAFLTPVSGQLNPVMWSLVVEVHFYLILPLLFLLTKRLSSKACLWTIPIFLFIVPVLIQSLTGIFPTFTPEISDRFCTGLSCFCFGVAVAGIDALKLWNKRWAILGDIGWFVIFFALTGMAYVETNPYLNHGIVPGSLHWLFFAGSSCLLCYAAAPENPRVRWLCTPWLRWCGIISYEWYLFHQPVIIWAREVFGPASGHFLKYVLILGIPLVVSVSFSALVYRIYSLPILKYGRSKNRRSS